MKELNHLCLTCAERKDCPMNEALETWESILTTYENESESVPSYIYEEYYIDEPDLEDGKVIWCPLYFKEEKP